MVDVWYLLGLTNKLRADFEAGEGDKEGGEGYQGNARYYLKKSLRVQAKHPSDDKAMIEHIKELLAEVGPGDGQDTGDKSDDEEVVEAGSKESITAEYINDLAAKLKSLSVQVGDMGTSIKHVSLS